MTQEYVQPSGLDPWLTMAPLLKREHRKRNRLVENRGNEDSEISWKSPTETSIWKLSKRLLEFGGEMKAEHRYLGVCWNADDNGRHGIESDYPGRGEERAAFHWYLQEERLLGRLR